VVFVCVPTPEAPAGADLSAVRATLAGLAPGTLVVLRSTVPPGSTDQLQAEWPELVLACSPEFLTERTAEENERRPARQIVGYTEQSRGAATEILRLLPRAPYSRTLPARSAEMIKLFSNSFYAIKVTFANQIYDLCQELGVDYADVRDAAEADPMIAAEHLDVHHAGYRGYGGKCLPKDSKALLAIARARGVDLSTLREADQYNDALRATERTPLQAVGE
jgi:UDPglucose 6-dehydrogenase